MEEIFRLYSNIPPDLRTKSRFWMSRETLSEMYKEILRGQRSVVIDVTGSVTLFGLPVMIDDRMPAGAISAETAYGTAKLN